METRLRWWRLQLLLTGAALLLAGMRCVQVYLGARARGTPAPWGGIVFSQLPPYLVWSIIATGLVYLARHVVERGVAPRRILAMTGALLVLLVCVVPLPYLAFFAWVMPDPRHSFWFQYRDEVLAGMGTCVLLFSTICGTAYCVFYYGRAQRNELAAARLSDQLSRARLEALRSQLNPHFLFNALNSIAMLARTGAQRETVRMIAGLSDLLRYSLDDGRPRIVTLEDELAFVTRYLEIEQVRFCDALACSMDVDDSLMSAEVPVLALHTLVENAVRHGVSQRPGPGHIRISAHVDGRLLTLEVRDDGVGFGHSKTRGAGIGLANTRARLRELYGEDGELSVDRDGLAGSGAVVSFSLPWSGAPFSVEELADA